MGYKIEQIKTEYVKLAIVQEEIQKTQILKHTYAK